MSFCRHAAKVMLAALPTPVDYAFDMAEGFARPGRSWRSRRIAVGSAATSWSSRQ